MEKYIDKVKDYLERCGMHYAFNKEEQTILAEFPDMTYGFSYLIYRFEKRVAYAAFMTTQPVIDRNSGYIQRILKEANYKTAEGMYLIDTVAQSLCYFNECRIKEKPGKEDMKCFEAFIAIPAIQPKEILRRMHEPPA